MSGSAPFRLNRSGMLLALISAAYAGQVDALAGRVDFTTTGVTVTGRDGRARPLARGAELDTGDTVRTGTDGRAQIRFTDGSYVSLQPNTDFAISEYEYKGKADGSERSFYGLVRGAMRTVTGAIGRVNRNAYRITTPTATVGIRGTGGVIQVLNDGSTLVIGTSGIWSLTNPAGSIDVPAGVSGLSPSDPNTPPQETTTQPTSGPAEPPKEETQFVQGEERTETGEVVIAPVTPPLGPLVTGTGYFSVLAFSHFGPELFPVFGDALFDATGRLTEFSDSSGQLFKLDPATGVHADFGTDGILAWGRWTGLVSGAYDFDGVLPFSATYNDNQGLHYVVGMPTLVMPTSGTASYSLIGATRPTYIDGSVSPGMFTGSLSVTFGASPTLSMNLNIAMPDSKGYALGGTIPVSGISFVGFNFGGQGNGMTVSGSGGACSSGCDALMTGFFAGANAERAGLGYHVNDFLANKDVIGAAAFKKQ
jgi:hypothetical protein